MKDVARGNLERRLAYVNDQLGGHDFLLDNTYSVADAYLFTVLGWAKYIKLDLSAWPNLTGFQARMASRPAVQRAMKAEGLI